MIVLGVWAMASLLFVALGVAPEILMSPPTGGPRPTQAGPPISLQEQLQLHGTLHEQYLHFMRRLLTLDLGPSVLSGQPTVKVLAETAPRTLTLLLLALLLALPLGRWLSALANYGSEVRRFQVGLLLAGLLSVFLPFWGSLLRWGLSRQMGLLPSSGLVNFDLWQQTALSVNDLLISLSATLSVALLGAFGTWSATARLRVGGRYAAPLLSISVFCVLVLGAAMTAGAERLNLLLDLIRHMILPLLTLVPVLAAASALFVYTENFGPARYALFATFSIGALVTVEISFGWSGLGWLWRAPVRSDIPVLLGSLWLFTLIALLGSALLAQRRVSHPPPALAPHRGLLWLGGGLVMLFGLLALLGPLLHATLWSAVEPGGNRVYDPIAGYDRQLETLPATPSPTHLLGTDRWARDLFSQILYGAGRAFVVGGGAALAGVVGGVVLGILLRRWPALLRFGAWLILSFPLMPGLLLASGIWAWEHAGLGLVLGLCSAPLIALQIQPLAPLRWSTVVGAAAALTMAYAVWVGHILSFLRMGRFESLLDWGLMLDALALGDPVRWWWLALPPALSISLLTLGGYLLAWGLRARA